MAARSKADGNATAAPDPPLVLDANLLTPRDLKQAKGALGGQDVAKMLDDPIDSITLAIFCLRRRSDPDFSWDDALDTPLSAFNKPEQPPDPPTPSPGSNGSRTASPS